MGSRQGSDASSSVYRDTRAAEAARATQLELWQAHSQRLPSTPDSGASLYGQGPVANGDTGSIERVSRDVTEGLEMYKASRAIVETGLVSSEDSVARASLRALESISASMTRLEGALTHLSDRQEASETLLRMLLDQSLETNVVLRRSERMVGVTRHGGTVPGPMAVQPGHSMTEVFASRNDMIIFYIVLVYRCIANEIRKAPGNAQGSVYETEAITTKRIRTAVISAIDVAVSRYACVLPASNDHCCAAFAQCLKPYVGPEGTHFALSYLGHLESSAQFKPITIFINGLWPRLQLCTTGLPSSFRQIVKRLNVPFVTDVGLPNCSLEPVGAEQMSTGDRDLQSLKHPVLSGYYKGRASGLSHIIALSRAREASQALKGAPVRPMAVRVAAIKRQ